MKDEIVLYQPDDQLSLEVKVENDTVWLNRNQMAVLFDRDVKTIGKHINNALQEELAPVVAKFAPTQIEDPTVAKNATVQNQHTVPPMTQNRAKTERKRSFFYASTFHSITLSHKIISSERYFQKVLISLRSNDYFGIYRNKTSKIFGVNLLKSSE